MALKGKATSGGGGDGPVEVLEADTYDGVLVGIIDLGMHDGQFGRKRQVLLVWELCGVERSDGKPWYIGRRYTLSFNEKASLRKDLEVHRRKKFAEGEDIDPTAFVGTLWQLTVNNQERERDGKKRVYWDLAQVGAPKRNAAVPKPAAEPLVFDCDSDEQFPNPEWLPRVYGEKVADLVELGRRNMRAGRVAAAAGTGGADDEGDIPF